MNNKPIYKYSCVYRITNKITGIHYVGSHSSRIHTPEQDIGIHYFGSPASNNTEGIAFREDAKLHPENYKFKIVKTFPNTIKEVSLAYETRYLTRVNAKNNKKFVNKSNGNNFYCDRTGMVSVKNRITGELCGSVSRDDPRYVSKELVSVMLGTTWSPEARLSLVGRGIGLKQSQETIDKRRNTRKGYSHSQETREKMSVAGKGKKQSIEHTIKNSEVHKIYIYYTPLGITDDCRSFEPTLPKSSLHKMCTEPDKKISKITYAMSKFLKLYSWEELEGKTFRDIGFCRELKNKLSSPLPINNID